MCALNPAWQSHFMPSGAGAGGPGGAGGAGGGGGGCVGRMAVAWQVPEEALPLQSGPGGPIGGWARLVRGGIGGVM